MSSKLLKRYLPTGETRAIYTDARRHLLRNEEVDRASLINPIKDGPKRGCFYVDFSLLADATGDDRYRLCLTETFETYTEANQAEVAWLEANYIREGLCSGGT